MALFTCPYGVFHVLVHISENKQLYYDSVNVTMINGCTSRALVFLPLWPNCCCAIQRQVGHFKAARPRGRRESAVMSYSNVHGGFISETSKHSRELPLSAFKIGFCEYEDGIF